MTSRSNRPLIFIVALGVACVALLAIVGFLLLGRNPAPTKTSAAAKVPSIENIPQPNPACTPAADRKIGLGDDITQIEWFGWMDGKQVDMPLGQALSMRINGHDVRDAWYCPPRADW